MAENTKTNAQSSGSKTTTNETATKATDSKLNSTTSESQIFTIESLKEEFKINDSIFAAVKISKGWAEGKQVSKTDFKTAVDEWLKAPISK